MSQKLRRTWQIYLALILKETMREDLDFQNKSAKICDFQNYFHFWPCATAFWMWNTALNHIFSHLRCSRDLNGRECCPCPDSFLKLTHDSSWWQQPGLWMCASTLTQLSAFDFCAESSNSGERNLMIMGCFFQNNIESHLKRKDLFPPTAVLSCTQPRQTKAV